MILADTGDTEREKKNGDNMLYIIIGCCCAALVIIIIIIVIIVKKKRNDFSSESAIEMCEEHTEVTSEISMISTGIVEESDPFAADFEEVTRKIF